MIDKRVIYKYTRSNASLYDIAPAVDLVRYFHGDWDEAKKLQKQDFNRVDELIKKHSIEPQQEKEIELIKVMSNTIHYIYKMLYSEAERYKADMLLLHDGAISEQYKYIQSFLTEIMQPNCEIKLTIRDGHSEEVRLKGRRSLVLGKNDTPIYLIDRDMLQLPYYKDAKNRTFCFLDGEDDTETIKDIIVRAIKDCQERKIQGGEKRARINGEFFGKLKPLYDYLTACENCGIWHTAHTATMTEGKTDFICKLFGLDPNKHKNIDNLIKMG